MKLAENAFHELSAKFDHLDKFALREKEERYLLFIKKKRRRIASILEKKENQRKTFIEMFHVKHFTDKIHRCFT